MFWPEYYWETPGLERYHNMKFGNLNYLWLLPLIPALMIFFVYAARQKRKAAERFAQYKSWLGLLDSVSTRKAKIKRGLILVGMLFVIITLIQPQWGYHWEEIKRKGIDILVCLDVSRSMLAEDVRPNRLERAKKEIESLIGTLKGDRIGLVAFAGTAFIQCPLTLDYTTAKLFLNDIDPGIIPRGGTDIGQAIKKGMEAFANKETKVVSASLTKNRVIILITDGEDMSGQAAAAAEEAKKENIVIYPVAVGYAEGAPIPITDEQGNRAYVKDRNGRVVISKVDQTTLNKVARITGGRSGGIGTGQFSLIDIYTREIGKLEKEELGSTKRKRYHDRFQWPLGLVILILAAESMLTERTGRRRIQTKT